MTRARVEAIRTRFRCAVSSSSTARRRPARSQCCGRATWRASRDDHGRPAPNVDVRVVGDDGRDVAPGAQARSSSRSVFNLLGYWKAPRRRRGRFATDGCTPAIWRPVDEEGISLHRRPLEGSHPQRRREHLPRRARKRVLLSHPDVRRRGSGEAPTLGRSRGGIVPRSGATLTAGQVAARRHASGRLQEASPRGVLDGCRTAAAHRVSASRFCCGAKSWPGCGSK